MSDIGVIGCGKQGGRHLAALKAGEAGVVCADLDDAAALNLARRTGSRHATVGALLDDPSVGGVIIATPTPTHFGLISRALRAGKHVLCEKPLTQTVPEAEALLNIEYEVSRRVLVGFIYRYVPAFERIHALRNNGALGPLIHACVRIGGRGDHRTWKHDRARGGGVLNEMAVHMLDAALWLFGEMSNCEVLSTATLQPRRVIGGREVDVDAEDYLVVRLTTRSGAPILLVADMVTPAFTQYIDAQYENASALASIDGKFPGSLFLKEARAGLDAGAQGLSQGSSDLYCRQADAFMRMITTGQAPVSCGIAESISVLRMAEEIRGQISSRLPSQQKRATV